jgi:hypothetical protein
MKQFRRSAIISASQAIGGVAELEPFWYGLDTEGRYLLGGIQKAVIFF